MIKKINYKIIINILGFYVCWWLSVYGAIQGEYFLGPKSLFFYIIIHFVFVVDNKIEYLYILICTLLAFLLDSILLNLNIIGYEGILSKKYNIAPLWVVSLWVSYALSIFHSFKILQKNYNSAKLLGFFSGPFIYFSFSQMGIIHFLFPPLFVLTLISILWIFMIPLYVYIADKLIDEYA